MTYNRAAITTCKAPWGTSLTVTSSLVTIIVLIGVVSFARSKTAPHWPALLGMAVLFVALLFTVRGYSVTADALLVHRLFWKHRVPLAGLQSAQFDPKAMSRSVRLFGNGGAFSFSGWFRSKRLGNYRAFVTDPRRAVVLRFPNRTIVISPSNPAQFVSALQPFVARVA